MLKFAARWLCSRRQVFAQTKPSQQRPLSADPSRVVGVSSCSSTLWKKGVGAQLHMCMRARIFDPPTPTHPLSSTTLASLKLSMSIIYGSAGEWLSDWIFLSLSLSLPFSFYVLSFFSISFPCFQITHITKFVNSETGFTFRTLFEDLAYLGQPS